MGGSIIINVLVYTQNGGSPIISSIGLNTNIFDSPNNNSSGLEVENVWVYTPGGSPKNNSGCSLHTNGWLTNYQCYGLLTIWSFA